MTEIYIISVKQNNSTPEEFNEKLHKLAKSSLKSDEYNLIFRESEKFNDLEDVHKSFSKGKSLYVFFYIHTIKWSMLKHHISSYIAVIKKIQSQFKLPVKFYFLFNEKIDGQFHSITKMDINYESIENTWIMSFDEDKIIADNEYWPNFFSDFLKELEKRKNIFLLSLDCDSLVKPVEAWLHDGLGIPNIKTIRLTDRKIEDHVHHAFENSNAIIVLYYPNKKVATKLIPEPLLAFGFGFIYSRDYYEKINHNHKYDKYRDKLIYVQCFNHNNTKKVTYTNEIMNEEKVIKIFESGGMGKLIQELKDRGYELNDSNALTTKYLTALQNLKC